MWLNLKTLMSVSISLLIVISSPVSFAETITYTYDNLNRVIKADYGNGKTITYTYDAAGNRLNMNSVTDTAIPTPTGTPTVITLVYFKAKAGDNGTVTLTWETAAEIDSSGFNIYRAKHKDGAYIMVNDTLVPAKGDAVSGAIYSYVDMPGRGTFYYKLEDVNKNGVSTMHGPEKIKVKSTDNLSRRSKGMRR